MRLYSYQVLWLVALGGRGGGGNVRSAKSWERKYSINEKGSFFRLLTRSPHLLIPFRKPNAQQGVTEQMVFLKERVLISVLMVILSSKIHHEALAYNLSIALASAWTLSIEHIRLNDEALLPIQQKREIFSDTRLKLPRLNS